MVLWICRVSAKSWYNKWLLLQVWTRFSWQHLHWTQEERPAWFGKDGYIGRIKMGWHHVNENVIIICNRSVLLKEREITVLLVGMSAWSLTMDNWLLRRYWNFIPHLVIIRCLTYRPISLRCDDTVPQQTLTQWLYFRHDPYGFSFDTRGNCFLFLQEP